MRTYEKPMMMVEKFHAENAVATGCYAETKTSFPAQTVNCVLTGSETIFYTSTNSACVSNVETAGTLTTYGSSYVFVWYNSYDPGGNTPDTTTLTAIESAVYPSAVGQKGWHAGYVNGESYTEMNHTS